MWIAHANCKTTGAGMVTRGRSSYCIECNVLQLQHNHKRTHKIRYPWPISAVANLSIVGAFDNMHKRYRYCWFIDATCAATAAHCLLVTPVLPLLLPSPLSRVGDCLIYCLFAPLYSFSSFCALNFECFFITFFFLLVSRRWEFITSVANWICQRRLLR